MKNDLKGLSTESQGAIHFSKKMLVSRAVRHVSTVQLVSGNSGAVDGLREKTWQTSRGVPLVNFIISAHFYVCRVTTCAAAECLMQSESGRCLRLYSSSYSCLITNTAYSCPTSRHLSHILGDDALGATDALIISYTIVRHLPPFSSFILYSSAVDRSVNSRLVHSVVQE